ncbi:MAG: GH116 family glycosyl hydrolase, partial [Armatimonadetes bacterium]|nr:GH116 family glycosyl hydrolase [Armatimonadota bacterium]
VQQLKRWRERDGWYELSLQADVWIEAEGTGDYDLRFLGRRPNLRWHLGGKQTMLEITPGLTRSGEGGATRLAIEVLPRQDTIPADWPRFEMPSAQDAQEANTFFYERAFTYPPVWGPAAWFEWNALTRFWHGGRHLEEIASMLETYPISEEGYVHTWGAGAGWPFPDNAVYDTRHFDTNARFILACWRYAAWTGDVEFLRRQAERLRKAMEYQLTVLKGQDGLIVTASKDVTGRHKGVGNNYWDILPFGHLDAYANAVWYGSLEAMAQIEEMLAAAGGAETAAGARPAEYYRALREKARRAYNETFWDKQAGRYIGCVDIDGNRHDYGFTFVNLEAMAYGLADEEQARHIYRWMENEPTSTGQADTYTAYVFAPRSNTIHNPMWHPDRGKLEDVPHQPWWFFGWLGTPYGNVQCQDGGAILYTSFFDLMARTELLGPDNAWRRWREILSRWREPDHLVGGPPLFRGEMPQQINPGAVGTDIPFPESGLVPCWLLYGLMGVEATARGLEIAPRLPESLPWLEVRNLAYRGLPLTLRVTRQEALITCDAPGYEFRWTGRLGRDGRAVFTSPPEPVKFPEKPLWQSSPGPWVARWIWLKDPEAPRAFFRYVFTLAARPEKAWLSVTADNGFSLYLNGRKIGGGSNWAELFSFDLTPHLGRGQNVLAIEADNAGGPGGVVAQGEIMLPGGEKLIVATDRTWRVAEKVEPGWQEIAHLGGEWRLAKEYGTPPCGPWGDIGDPAPPK